MNKRPSFQFYPGDWVRDNVSGCSLSGQGLWLRMMVVMHDSERYGYLSQNGQAIPDEAIARKCGTTLQEYRALLQELDAAGVPSRTENGVIYSRRMVRDERERAQDRDYMKRSRVKGKCEADVRSLSVLSSSSSSPSSSEQNPPVKPPRSFAPPTLTEVKFYMKNDKWAEDFFDYFQSNGWKVGGRAPMKDWQAAARRWKRTELARQPLSSRSTSPTDGKKACWICRKIVNERDYRAHVDVCTAENRAKLPAGGLLSSYDELIAATAAASKLTKPGVPHEKR